MLINIFYIVGIIGLILLIFGVLLKNKDRKLRDIVYIVGGIFLFIYSYYIGDKIFMILQTVFILVAIYDLKKEVKI